MNNYKVYVHINKANGKRYFGVTKQDVNKRWKNGKGYPNNKYFTKDINKYGWENFEHIVIAKGLTEEEAKWLEIELIREWDTSNREYGYNKSLGGESINGYKFTEATRKKMSEAHKSEKIKVYCVELDKYFDSITEASKYIGRSDKNISNVLHGRSKTCGGYHWVYAEDVEKLDIENDKVS